MDNTAKVYMIYKDGGDMPTIEHLLKSDAEIELGRLSRKEPNENFYLLEITKEFSSTFNIVDIRVGGKKIAVGLENAGEPEGEVIEVGDTVRYGHPKCINADCKVAYILHSEERCCLENAMGCQECIVSIARLTLIHKGPKVHEFKGVVIFKMKGRPCNAFFPSQAVEGYDALLKDFHQDGNTYTLKLIKEDN